MNWKFANLRHDEMLRVLFIGRTGNYCVASALLLAGLLLGAGWPTWAADEPEDARTTLRLAPIRLMFSKGGSVDYQLKYEKQNARKVMQQTVGVTVAVGARAQSFIWQPWIAQVGGELRGSVTSTAVDYSTGSLGMKRQNQALYRTITGATDLKIFPNSRFPFSAKVQRSDSRRESGGANMHAIDNTLTDTLELTQDYRPYRGSLRFYGNYKRNRSEDLNLTVKHDNTLDVRLSGVPGPGQAMEIRSLRTGGDNSSASSKFSNNNLTARHLFWAGGQVLSVSTLATSVNTKYNQLATETGTEMLQLSSNGTWRPNDKFTMTGGVRLYDSSTNNGAITVAKNGYTGGNLGANYALARWLRLYGSVDVYDNNGTQRVNSTTLSNLSVAAQHRPDALKLWGYSYTRYFYANVSNNFVKVVDQTNNTTSSVSYKSYSLRLQHGLGNNVQVRGGVVGSSISQSLNTNGDSRRYPVADLLHKAVVSWRRSGTMLSLSGSDMRTLTQGGHFFQSVNLQGGQTERVKGGAVINGDITVDLTRRGSDASPAASTMTSSASLSYTHPRFLDVPRLIFISSLRLVSADLLQLNYMNQNAQNMGQYYWKNYLGYKIGQVTADTEFTMRENQGSKYALLMFHARRVF